MYWWLIFVSWDFLTIPPLHDVLVFCYEVFYEYEEALDIYDEDYLDTWTYWGIAEVSLSSCILTLLMFQFFLYSAGWNSWLDYWTYQILNSLSLSLLVAKVIIILVEMN